MKEMYQPGIDGSRHLKLEPRIEGHLKLVREQVGMMFDLCGWPTSNRERYDELFSIGETKLADILSENPEPTNALIRKSLRNAFLDGYRPQLSINRRTRSRRVASGKEFSDFKQHSLDAVFDSNGVSVKSLAANPHWADTESQWTTAVPGDQEVFEAYEFLYSLTRDELDRQILEARWDNGLYVPTDGDSLNQMLHIDDVAALCGLHPKEVQRRLNNLEARYYKQAFRKPPTGRMPQGNRRLSRLAAAA
ncbi:MAG: hypothetical protein C0485_07990 [Pirellula sp.]|nr:hypothetical protein [Pirellula sp.]